MHAGIKYTLLCLRGRMALVKPTYPVIFLIKLILLGIFVVLFSFTFHELAVLYHRYVFMLLFFSSQLDPFLFHYTDPQNS